MIKKLATLLIMLSLCYGIEAMTPELSKNYVSMRSFHRLYDLLCLAGLGHSILHSLDATEPPSPENGNRTFTERYEEWARENSIKIPTNGYKF